MGKINNKIHDFFERNLHHLQETLFAFTLVVVVGGFVLSNIDQGSEHLKAFLLNDQSINAEMLSAKSSLSLEDKNAPESVITFSGDEVQAWTSNTALIKNIFKDTLIARVLAVGKYILGGIFALFLSLYVLNFLTAGDKPEALKKFNDRMMWAFVGFIIFAIAQPLAEAFVLLRDTSPTGKIDLLTNPDTMLASANIIGFTYRSATHLVQYILGAVALLTMGASVFQMVSAVGNEESVKNARRSIAWSAIALVIVGGSALLIDKVFAPTETVQAQITEGSLAAEQLSEILKSGQSQARIITLNYVKYFQTLIGASAVLMLFLSGFKMVSAGGNEEIVTKQRKMITWIFMGLSIILLAETLVNIFMPDVAGEIVFNSTTAISSFSTQIGGFTNFFLAFTAVLAMLAFIVGALYITTAFANPEQAEKGKKILLAASLGLVITISAYALVNTVLSSRNASQTSIFIST